MVGWSTVVVSRAIREADGRVADDRASSGKEDRITLFTTEIRRHGERQFLNKPFSSARIPLALDVFSQYSDLPVFLRASVSPWLDFMYANSANHDYRDGADRRLVCAGAAEAGVCREHCGVRSRVGTEAGEDVWGDR